MKPRKARSDVTYICGDIYIDIHPEITIIQLLNTMDPWYLQVSISKETVLRELSKFSECIEFEHNG
jgi:hypothetical protein